MTTEARNKRALLKPLAVLGLLAAVLAVLVLSPSPAESAFPGWNGKIAFTSDRDGNGEIYVMDADGANQTRLTSNPADDGRPAWSADGTKIAFFSDRDGSGEIYVMDADGGNQTNLTNNSDAWDTAPAWSPDGTQIAFTSTLVGFGDFPEEIFVMDADGGNQTQLTDIGGMIGDLEWSPDGTKIAFASSPPDLNFDIYVMDADGSNQTNLTNIHGMICCPAWSSDGTQIAFADAFFTPEIVGGEIFVMNAADGSGQTNLTNSPLVYDVFPAWSPDGSKIAFQSREPPDAPGVNFEIYVMNAVGSGQTNITNNPAHDTVPDWQPLVGPVTSNVVAAPNPVAVGTAVTLAANVDDSTTGGSDIASAEYNIDGGSFVDMSADDGTFDEVSEDVTAGVPAFTEPGLHTVCVHGTDAPGNISADECILLAVYDPSAGFVTGGGWVNSPAGADADYGKAAGRANFGFVSKYHKGATTPDGNLEFQFKAGDLNFKSTSMEWLVVTGEPRAMFRGEGTINGVTVCKFQVDAWDDSFGVGVDAFGIKITACGGSDRYSLSATPLEGGSIMIHTEK